MRCASWTLVSTSLLAPSVLLQSVPTPRCGKAVHCWRRLLEREDVVGWCLEAHTFVESCGVGKDSPIPVYNFRCVLFLTCDRSLGCCECVCEDVNGGSAVPLRTRNNFAFGLSQLINILTSYLLVVVHFCASILPSCNVLPGVPIR